MKTEFKWNHIILADDDDDDCTIFTEALASLHPGLKLSISANGAELMDHLVQSPEPIPDVIFLDINMPLKSGIDCLQDIRSNASLKDNIIIMLTTSSNNDDIESSYNEGANFFITKPISFGGLCGLITKAFSSVTEYGSTQPPRKDFVLHA
ncbi:response regulator [Flavobacterium sp. MFBS3-15]|jgi:CheY-like chemotaxis protein|uniref:response regulator n=1 Tax=Flavobacterium sp. MFBS3-15 TaxID=2989816 RepID=UPI0022359988|nr:response regulator [Flavobacterium sp. MFBS3-15]MCW4470106.1 response regulator [Flavobacterium sp. MFBS3-15]